MKIQFEIDEDGNFVSGTVVDTKPCTSIGVMPGFFDYVTSDMRVYEPVKNDPI